MEQIYFLSLSTNCTVSALLKKMTFEQFKQDNLEPFFFCFRACMLGWRCCRHRNAYHIARHVAFVHLSYQQTQWHTDAIGALTGRQSEMPDKLFKHFFHKEKKPCRLFFCTQRNQPAIAKTAYLQGQKSRTLRSTWAREAGERSLELKTSILTEENIEEGI